MTQPPIIQPPVVVPSLDPYAAVAVPQVKRGAVSADPTGFAALTPEQQAATLRVRQRREAEEQQTRAAEQYQAALEEKHGALDSVALAYSRGVIDAVLSPGAIYGMQAEVAGTLTGQGWLRDFGRDLGESSNASALMATMAEAFARPDAPLAPGQSQLTPGAAVKRLIAQRQQAWPLLSGLSHTAGLAAPALLTGGAAAGAGASAAAGSTLTRVGAAAGMGALEGAAGGAQQAYEDARPLRDVLTSSLVAGTLGGVTGGTFAAGGALFRRGVGSGVAGEGLREFAGERMGKALGVIQSSAKKAGGWEQVRRVGTDVLDYRFANGEALVPERALKAGTMSLDEIGERVAAAQDEVGSGIGTIRRAANDYIESEAKDLRPNVRELEKQIREEVLDALEKSPLRANEAAPIRKVLKELDQARAVRKPEPSLPAHTAADVPPPRAAQLPPLDEGSVIPEESIGPLLGISSDELKSAARLTDEVNALGSILNTRTKDGTRINVTVKNSGGRKIAEINDLDAGQTGKGVGSRHLANMLDAFERAGIERVDLRSTDVGRYYWPRKGFPLKQGEFDVVLKAFKGTLSEAELERLGPINSIQDIAKLPEGKQFLLSRASPNLDYRVSVGSPEWKAIREALPAAVQAQTQAKPVSWREFLKGRMGPAMKAHGGDHTKAVRALSAEYKAMKAGGATPEVAAPAAAPPVVDDTISLAKLREVHENIKAKIYRESSPLVPHAMEQLKRVERMFDDAVTAAVDRVAPKLGEQQFGQYRQLKRLYQSFSQAHDWTQQGLARQGGNRFISLTDTGTGLAAAAGDLAGGGGIFSAAKGLAAAAGHKYAREHGSAFFAVLANNLAKRGVKVPGLAPRAGTALELTEGNILGQWVSSTVAGGREGAAVLTELERARIQAARAVEAAGPNPELREAARQTAREEMAARLAERAGAYDPAGWAVQAPTPLQKVVFRAQLLDRVGSDVATVFSQASRLFPGRDFELDPGRLKRFTKNASGSEAIGNIQARARSLFDDAPPTAEGDALRRAAHGALDALASADVPTAMAIGHALARTLGQIATTAREDLTKGFAARAASGFTDDLSSDAFGDAGRLYARLNARPGEDVETLSDPANARDALRILETRGRLPAIAKQLGDTALEAHQARAKLTGERVPTGVAQGNRAMEQHLARAEQVVTLDDGPVGRVFDYFAEKPAGRMGQEAPEDVVLTAVQPKMEKLLPALGRRTLDRDSAPPKRPAQLPQSKADLQSLYKERLEYLTETAIAPDELALEDQLSGMPNVPPALATMVASDAQERMLQLLKDLPKPREDIRGKAYESLSSDQLRVANAMWEATTEPLSVFDDFERGAVDYDKVKYAWKQYPGLKQAAQVGFLDAVHSHLSEDERANIPDTTLTQMDYLLAFNGTLQGTVNRDFAARVSAMHEAQQKQQQGGRPGGQLDMPSATPTFTQRISNMRRAS